MESLIKKPYSISLWDEETVYLITETGDEKDKYETAILPSNPNSYTLLNKYVKEKCLAVIGSNTMDTPIRAFEPKLVRQTNGTNTLTFQMFYRYYDDEDNTFKLNPFTNLMVNERKIKLSYDGNWHDLIIKQIQEDSQKYTFTYTCQDLYITELSKNGYSLVFDTELENNMGTITELGAEVLKGTEWFVDAEACDVLIQKNEEAVFTYELEEKIVNPIIITFNEKGEKIETVFGGTIPKGDIILIDHTSYRNWKLGEKVYFYWVKNGEYEIDDDRVVINSPIYSFVPPDSFGDTSLKMTSNYRGNFPVYSRKVTYIPEIERYCYEYVKEEDEEIVPYYAFVGSDFLSAVDVQNLLTNPNNFSSDFGWIGEENAVVTYNKDTGLLELNYAGGGKVKNSGLSDSLALLQGYKGISKGDKFVLLVKTAEGSSGEINNVLINVDEVLINDDEDLGCKKLTNSYVDGYSTFVITCNKSFSYRELVNNPPELLLSGKGKVILEDAKFFKEVKISYIIKDDNGVEQKVTSVFIPDLNPVTESAIKDKYYFFKASELEKVITTIDDIVFEGKYFEEDIPEDFKEVPKENPYEKVTSITASKSNRFNLIQTLCETFECWARFVIGHESDGRVKHLYTLSEDLSPVEGKTYYQKITDTDSDNDPKNFKVVAAEESPKGKYYEHSLDKRVVFKEYIGNDNYAGFRYGINLKGITRNIDSKQIVTKLIVEANSNEYAPDGFCTIQRAAMNPSRENVIYNFSYYINNGLLNQDELSVDLYDSVNGIGLYDRLYELNIASEPLINKQVELKTAYDKARAYEIYHSSALKQAGNNKIEYEEELEKIIGEVPSTLNPDKDKYNDVVNELIRKLKYAKEVIARETENINYIEPILKNYKKEIEDIEKSLSSFTKQKELLNAEFFKKYSRFVQEGTWISEDYFDEDLYFFDACKVSATSAFPQISYNINVLEVSGVDGYQNYKFDIGDKTYIEDVEFFGYVKDTGRPYQEEVIVSEIQTFLDNPANNVIKVQNYKTRFEDLFQRVAAATQALQYAEGKYNRASNAIKENNTISGSVLEKTLNYNFLLSDAISKEVAQGGQVIDLHSVSQPNRYVRLSGLGIQLSKDGGLNWQTAITADGINADVGVFGSLHTNNLTIYNGDDEAFFWDKNGITAYNTIDGTGTTYNQFVRFTKYGIYGYKGAQDKHYQPVSIEDIQDNSVFSLTWDGLELNSLNGKDGVGNYLKMSVTDSDETTNNRKVIRVGSRDKNNKETDKFIVYENGKIKATGGEFEGKITAEEGYIGKWEISENGLHNEAEDTGFFSTGDVFRVGTKFSVTSSGILKANGAQISGSGTFSGTIKADDGYFSGRLTGNPIVTESYFEMPAGYGLIGMGEGTRADEETGEEEITTGIVITQNTDLIKKKKYSDDEYVIDATQTKRDLVYLFVSSGGIRLQAGYNKLVLTNTGIYFTGDVSINGTWLEY